MKDSDICRAEIIQLIDKLEHITLEPGEILATIGDEVDAGAYWVSTKNKGTGYVEMTGADGKVVRRGPSQIFSYGRHAMIVENLAAVDTAAAVEYSKDHHLLNWDTEEGISDLRRSLQERQACTAQFTTRVRGTATVHIRKLTAKVFREVLYDTSRLGRQYKTRLLHEGAHETLSHEKLEKVRLLGQGSFGQVWLCREPTQDLAYAMKIQYKRELIIQHQARGVVREASVMRRMHHPFVTGIVHAEQDPHRLYMVMDLFPGGELRSRMRNATKNVMAENEAGFYAACMLEGLSYMHRREYVYRDLKGENVLLDRDGYCVIVDLGFAKHVPDKTFTFCGTPIFIVRMNECTNPCPLALHRPYSVVVTFFFLCFAFSGPNFFSIRPRAIRAPPQAPEVLLNKGHDKSADIWSLGIMIFEMIFGTNPFFDYDDPTINQRKLFKRIVKGKFQTPVKQFALDAYKHTSKEAKDLIKKLLETDPDKRLGCLPAADLDIRKHPWFADCDWGKLYRKELEAPWIPELSDPFDGNNFKRVDLRTNVGLRPLDEEEQQVFDGFC